MLEFICLGCRGVLAKLPGPGEPKRAMTVGACCAQTYGLTKCFR